MAYTELTKSEECRHFEMFMKLYRSNYSSANLKAINLDEAEWKHSDNPDFHILLPDLVIGIEHSRIYKDKGEKRSTPPPQALDNITRQVVNCVQDLAVNSKLIPLKVSIFMNLRRSYNSKSKMEIAKGIFRSIETEVNSNDLLNMNQPIHIRAYNFSEYLYENYPGVSGEALVWLNDPNKGHEWKYVNAAEVISDREIIKIIQEAINKKNALASAYKKQLASYKQKQRELWLLLVAEGYPHFNSSYTLQAGKNGIDYCFNTYFDKVYFLDLFNLQLSLLNCTRLE